GNEGLWVPSPNIQHPQAKLEIVCWDSSLMLLLSNDINIDDKFRNYFKEARDLNAYNSEF
ncbi:hypothetical protein PDN55_29220, partial [Bacillus cereus]|nr:hypothetical protein [Bacillus cereus]